MPGSARREAAVTQHWVFTMTAAFLYAAAVLRSLLEFGGDQLGLVLVLLASWIVLLLAEPSLSRRWAPFFDVYLALQVVIAATLLGQSDGSDYFAVLLAILGMQAMQRWRPRAAFALIALSAVLMELALADEFGWAQAVTLSAVYTALNLFLGSFALAARRATEARAANEALAADLREANQRLAESARQAEHLAGARERQRLARDLHDSVTQTLFSLTLAAHSAALLLHREPAALGPQLDQVDQLATSARAELDALSAELPSSFLAGVGLMASLHGHLDERLSRDGLTVSLQVEGDRRLPPDAEVALLRIVQEALNNVVKHAGVTEAAVRLRLRPPARLEIVDRGRGFGTRAPDEGGARAGRQGSEPGAPSGAGLGIMRERAAEIGWRLSVASSAGAGTRVVAEEDVDEGGGEHDWE